MHHEVPVWAVVQCPGFPPWGSFCSVLPSLWGSQTSPLHRHRIFGHAREEEKKVRLTMDCHLGSETAAYQARREQPRTHRSSWMWKDGGVYLAADHDVSDFWFAVTAVRLVVSRADWEDKVPGVALALSHQEAAVLAFFSQQFLCLPAW